jgi:hypothetical protein
LGSKPIPKKTATMDWSGKFRLLLHHSMIARFISQKKVNWYIGTRGISEINLSDSMQRWNGEYGITLSVSGINSKTNGFQKTSSRREAIRVFNTVFESAHTGVTTIVRGSMLKWFLLR